MVFEGTRGYWDANENLVREVSFADPEQEILLRVLAWSLNGGSTYWEALASGRGDVLVGNSVDAIIAAGTDENPAYLAGKIPNPGLRSFGMIPPVLIPEPTTWKLVAIGIICFFFTRIKSATIE